MAGKNIFITLLIMFSSYLVFSQSSVIKYAVNPKAGIYRRLGE
jgi:hypothetical protein